MLGKYMLCSVLLLLVLVLPYAKATVVGTASMEAPAVIIGNNTGSLTNITLTITNGNGNVVITGPSIVGNTTEQSAMTAAEYASNYTGHSFADYDFNYSIEDAGNNVSGPSAGAAMTMLAVSAFTGKKLRTDFTMTGTISSDGNIGEVGGVYDKVGAAKSAGFALVLVPKTGQDIQERELYYLVQTNFGIPLVQVANISQATHFAFNGSINGIANETHYSFYSNYSINGLTQASLNCTGYCNETVFGELLNATFNLTQSSINELGSNPKYANVSNQFSEVLNQSREVASKGYDYTAADIAFLDYVNVYFFNGYSTNRQSALELLQNTQSFCGSLQAPQLTTSNYDYVISAELRQAWGNYTINETVSSYNSSQIDSDEILDELYLGAQANGWCTAANLVYNEASNNQNGTDVVPSSNLKSTALDRINRALTYGNSLYLSTAEKAYKEGNYPVAILDADYSYALSTAGSSNSTTAQLDNLSVSIAENSTYSVWAYEFGKEALFYAYQSRETNNATMAKSYAQEGYSAALLASQISNDTKIIKANLVPGVSMVQQSPQQNSDMQKLLGYSEVIILALIAIIIILIVINAVLVSIIIRQGNKAKNTKTKRRTRK